MSNRQRIVIVGGGIAGFTAAKTLSEIGSDIETVLVNGEDRFPYKRTKISKNITKGFDRSAFTLASEEWYAEHGVRLVSGSRVARIDAADRKVTLQSGDVIDWSALILANGSEAAPLSVTGAQAVPAFVVRTAKDVERLIAGVKDAADVLVVGGGVLGVEVSEQLAQLGKRVTVCVSGDRLMPRELNGRAADGLANVLRAHGVDLVFNQHVRAVRYSTAKSIQVSMDGLEKACDAVVACVGVHPSTVLAAAAGLKVAHGVIVNEYLQTSAPAIFAAGDVAEHQRGVLTHLWHAAEYQGALAARNAVAYLSGGREPLSVFDNPPFRLKCEVFGQYYFSAGLIPGVTTPDSDMGSASDVMPEVIEQSDGRRYRLLSFEGDRLVGAIMTNDGERAKSYQSAVREGWTRSRVEEELSW